MNTNTITFKGVKSTSIQGLLISELPSIVKPTMRQEVMEVDGRHGDVYRFKGYDSYNKDVEIGLFGEYDIDQISDFFSGEGEVIFSNEPSKVYRARITRQIEYERLLRFRTAKVKFTVEPFKRLVGEKAVSSTTTPFNVENKGYMDSVPTFKLVGQAGQIVRVLIGGAEKMVVTIPPEGNITIDGEAMNCYNETGDKNQFVNLRHFATLKKGVNNVSWVGNLTKMTVEPKSRWV